MPLFYRLLAPILEGQVDTIFSNEKVNLLEEMLTKTPDHCTIFSGITNAYLNWDYR